MAINIASPEACFQLRHRYFDRVADKWHTLDLLGPYTLSTAISEANHILMLHSGAVDRAYVAIEDMGRPVSPMLTEGYHSDDICMMVGLMGTAAYYEFSNVKKKG